MPKPQIDWIDWFPLAGETSPKLFRYRQRGAADWVVKEDFQVEVMASDLKTYQFQVPLPPELLVTDKPKQTNQTKNPPTGHKG